MLTDFKGRAYSGGLRRSDGRSYDGGITDFRGNLINIEFPEYWRNNYTAARAWLGSKTGLRGTIVTDTHYSSAGRNLFQNSQSIRSAKQLQADFSDALFLHLGDIIDTKNDSIPNRFEADYGHLYRDRNIYMTGNHDVTPTSATGRECAIQLASYMDVVDVGSTKKVFYKDVLHDGMKIRFVAVNEAHAITPEHASVKAALDKDSADYFVFLSHKTPVVDNVDHNYTKYPLSGWDTTYAALGTLGNKCIGHWTGHHHWDDYVLWEGINFVTLNCDFCDKDNTDGRQADKANEGAMTCFNVDFANRRVEFARFGALVDDPKSNIVWSGNEFGYNF